MSSETNDTATKPLVRSEAMRAAASAAMVNRTHRIVRERARTIQARRQTMRELILPLTVSAALLAAVVFAIWTVLDEYDIAPTGLPDASQQIFVFLMWCLPISAAVLGVMLFQRIGTRNQGDIIRTDNEGAR